MIVNRFRVVIGACEPPQWAFYDVWRTLSTPIRARLDHIGHSLAVR